ncbi:MAG: hypothetical protein WC430_02580 [Patescibacteria group bacterium]
MKNFIFLGILFFSFSFTVFAQPVLFEGCDENKAFSQPIIFEGCDEQGYARCTPPVVKVKVAKRATPRLDKLEKGVEILKLGEDDALLKNSELNKRLEGIEQFLISEQESRQISDENLAERIKRIKGFEKRNVNVNVVYNKIYQHHHHRGFNLEIGVAGGLTPSVGCHEDKVSIFEEVGINLSLTFPLGNSKWVGKATGYIGLSPTVGLGWGGFFSTLRQFGNSFRVGPAIGGLIDSGTLAGTRVWNAGGGIEINFLIKNRVDLGVIGLIGINGEAVDANKGDYDLGWVVLPYINIVLF